MRRLSDSDGLGYVAWLDPHATVTQIALNSEATAAQPDCGSRTEGESRFGTHHAARESAKKAVWDLPGQIWRSRPRASHWRRSADG
jgi:hypothetical protein